MGKKKRMATLWEVPDPRGERMAPILDAPEPPRATGRPRVNRRRVLEGIIFRLRTGCQWNHIPRVYGDDSPIHRCFQRWCAQASLRKSGRCWWRSATNCKASIGNGKPLRPRWAKRGLGGAVGPNPTDRAEKGTTRSLLVEAAGGPLAIVVAAANGHDSKLLKPTLEAISVERPNPPSAKRNTGVSIKPMTIPPVKRQCSTQDTGRTCVGLVKKKL